MSGPENYRKWICCEGLIQTRISDKETDLLILASSGLFSRALPVVSLARTQLQNYILDVPEFSTSFTPLPLDPKSPEVVQAMLWAASIANVGPMAAVAGAISEFVGKKLVNYSAEMIVENGGDIYVHTTVQRTIAVYAGNSPLSGSIGLTVGPGTWGICTSSGTFGRSFSYGRADASMCLSHSAALSDAAATAVGNAVSHADDIGHALELAASINGIKGALVILGEKMGVWGNIELCDIENRTPGYL